MKTAHTIKVYLLMILLLLPASCLSKARELTVLTFSDLHGQLNPVAEENGGCQMESGGMARMATAVKTVRSQNPDRTLLFCCGDSLTGNYFLNFQGKAIFSTLDLLKIDAATLGNHEFDKGAKSLARTLDHTAFPMVQSNLALPENSPLAGRFLNYKVIKRNRLTIGVIGLMTPDLPLISKPGDITVPVDLAGSAENIIQQLKKQASPDLVIALTHIGLDKDIELAEKVPEIDLICGGHSHDLTQKDHETVISHPDKTKTIIVHPGSRGKYLGQLHLTIEKGNIIRHHWTPLPITDQLHADREMLTLINHYQEKLPETTVVTFSEEALDCRSESLRTKETKIGGLITDIIREHFHTDMAFQNGGGIRGDRILPAGDITAQDIDRMLPFENTVSILTLTGTDIRQVLEQSVSFLPEKYGGFLQISGLRFDVDPARPPFKMKRNGKTGALEIIHPGNRVSNITVASADHKDIPLIPDKSYRIAVNSFLASGGDGYVIFKRSKRFSTYTALRTIVKNTLNQEKQLPAVRLNRITIVK